MQRARRWPEMFRAFFLSRLLFSFENDGRSPLFIFGTLGVSLRSFLSVSVGFVSPDCICPCLSIAWPAMSAFCSFGRGHTS